MLEKMKNWKIVTLWSGSTFVLELLRVKGLKKMPIGKLWMSGTSQVQWSIGSIVDVIKLNFGDTLELLVC
jgi:hypothetical protein